MYDYKSGFNNKTEVNGKGGVDSAEKTKSFEIC